MSDAQDGWSWWASANDEWFTSGPYATRDEAIEAASIECIGEFKDEEDEGKWKLGFHLVEARQDPLRLADWILADEILDRAEEALSDSDLVSNEYEDAPRFDATAEQSSDLAERLKRACDEWQAAHGLKFKTATFSVTRNSEYVVVDHPVAEEAA